MQVHPELRAYLEKIPPHSSCEEEEIIKGKDDEEITDWEAYDKELDRRLAECYKSREPKTSVMVGHIPTGKNEEDIKNLFQNKEDIEEVRFLKAAHVLALVKFKTLDACEFALKQNEYNLDGSHLFIERAI